MAKIIQFYLNKISRISKCRDIKYIRGFKGLGREMPTEFLFGEMGKIWRQAVVMVPEEPECN